SWNATAASDQRLALRGYDSHNISAMHYPLPFPQNPHTYLESLAAEVHRTYFAKYPPLPVRWGNQITRKRRRSIRLGSYNHHTAESPVHPLLDAAQIHAYI